MSKQLQPPQEERKGSQSVSDMLREEFIDHIGDWHFPGISGEVRSLQVEIEPGYGEITLMSCSDDDILDVEDFFLLCLCTAHPQNETISVGEAYEDDPRKVTWVETHPNPHLHQGETPAFDRPVWWAMDTDTVVYELPVTILEGMQKLSEHLQEKGKAHKS